MEVLMIERIVTIIGAALSLVAVSEPAMAAIAQVPEPATMSLFGLGAASAFVAKKLIGRK